MLGKFRFRPPAPTPSSSVVSPTQKGVPAQRKVVLLAGVGNAKYTLESKSSREERW